MNKTRRRLRLAGAACAIFALGACGGVGVGVEFPADLSGEWTLTMDPDFRGDRTVSDCKIKHDDNKLSVRCSGRAEMAGTVKDGKVAWGFPAPAGEKYPAATWTGTVATSSNAMEGTWHLFIAGGDLDGKFSATKKAGQVR